MTDQSDSDAETRTDSSSARFALLPEPARTQAVDVASAVLPGIRIADMPKRLRRFVRFTAEKRAKHAAGILREELAQNPTFRSQVAQLVRSSDAPLVAQVLQGDIPAIAKPHEVAALAYLLQPEGWQDLVESASESLRTSEASAEVEQKVKDAHSAQAAAERDRDAAYKDNERLREEVLGMQEELATLRSDQHRLRRHLEEAQLALTKARNDLAAEKGRLKQLSGKHAAEAKKLREQLAQAETERDRAREAVRDSRQLHDSRLWLLLETLSGTTAGLRRELAMEPVVERPADHVADTRCAEPEKLAESSRGLHPSDPGRLLQLLELPQAHLIVDGYNVTMRAWKEISLEQQRNRLSKGLSGVAAQTGAEVTVVWDGSDPVVGLPPPPRGVRVLFSKKGQTADEVVRSLAAAEPSGRPVVVISSDREVAEGSARHGAYALPAEALINRLSRG
ncbi:NYN domain-containing protein [Natronoglycomyces albus]|uniref:NYN domain-containing protein n=1 Tax=Natronoglycomyces albus TaxID=2811108 RepID=A0A895XSS1_9ACTN|nr:NYN domain-containing protein [Natronoglycomyces albus]QSB06295.1 NYN domain-containing protein [Natronoglycomyces albus]